MHRSRQRTTSLFRRLASIAVLAIVLGTATGAVAASLPSGAINCVVSGDTDQPNGKWRLRFSPAISSVPSPNRMSVSTTMKGTCDNAGVSGGKAPITNVQAYLVGKLAAGTTCATLTSAPVFERLKLKIKWQTVDGSGRVRSVATTSARFVDADWDAGLEGLVLTSTPLKGAFGGSTATVTLTIDHPEVFGAVCQNAEIDGTTYGADGESSIAIF